MSTQRAVTNRLMYQSSLMADLAETAANGALRQAAREALILFQYQALCSALLEVCEHYQVKAQSQGLNLAVLLESLGQGRPDCWEYRTLTEAQRDATNWVSQLLKTARAGVDKAPEKLNKAAASGQLISVSIEDDATTNHYPNFQTDLQQWIDEMRSMNDQH
ncbi:MAG: hypothetical protein LAT65_16390 [Saccharospirillum sp.]|nr:hypothetical protein [Saccharospirillum sp.]